MTESEIEVIMATGHLKEILSILHHIATDFNFLIIAISLTACHDNI